MFCKEKVMVYSFAIGMFVGLPVGCWMREQGHHHRAMRAYRVMFPKEAAPISDSYQNTNEQYQKDLMAGRVEPKDFERYIYGKEYNKQRGTDERDLAETETR